MKNTLNTLVASIATAGLLAAVPGYGATVYSQEFSGSETIVPISGTGTVGTGQTLEYGEIQVGTWDTPSVVGGQLDVGGAFGSGNWRAQSVSIFIDTSGVSAGDYTWSFDISSFVDVAGAGNYASYSVFEGNNVDNNLTLRFRAQSASYDLFPIVDTVNSATFTQIGSSTLLTGDGTINEVFTLTEAGSAGDYVALTWYQRGTNTNPTDSFNLDNIVFSGPVIPEPSTLALIGAGFAMLTAARRRKARA